MVTKTFPGIAPLVIGTEDFEQRLQRNIDGKGFLVIEDTQVGPTPNFLTYRVRNPSGSGVIVVLVALRPTVLTNNRLVTNNYASPANANLGTVLTSRNKRGQGAAAKAAVSRANLAGLAAPTFGSARIPANDHRLLLPGIVLPADSSIDLQWTANGAGDTTELEIEWYEE